MVINNVHEISGSKVNVLKYHDFFSELMCVKNIAISGSKPLCFLNHHELSMESMISGMVHLVST